MSDSDRIRQMVSEGRITQEEADQLIAVLREVDAAGERLAAAGAAGADAVGGEHEAPAPAAEPGRPAEGTWAPEAAALPEVTVPQPAPHQDAASEPPAAQPRPDEQQGDAFSARPPATASAPEQPGQVPPPDTRPTDHRTADHHQRMAEHARDAARQARDAAKEAQRAARAAARDAAREARDAAREAMRAARDSGREVARQAREAAQEMTREASRGAQDLSHSAAAAAQAGVEAAAAGAAAAASSVRQPPEAGRPGPAVAPADTRWVTVEMLGGDLDVVAVPGLEKPRVEGGPGELTVEEVEDGYRIQFAPDRTGFLSGLFSSLRSGDINIEVPPGFGLRIEATAGDVSLKGVRYLRGRMRAGDLSADRLEGVDFSMTAGEFEATLDLRSGRHAVSVGAGNVEVAISQSSDVVVDGRVSIGDIGSDLPGMGRRGSGLGGSLAGTLGTGQASLELRVTTGDIEIRAAKER